MEGFENHIRGASSIVGITIFSIEEYLGFGHSLDRMYLILLREGLDLQLLHMQQILVK